MTREQQIKQLKKRGVFVPHKKLTDVQVAALYGLYFEPMSDAIRNGMKDVNLILGNDAFTA
jgi:hypothetical protein